MLPNKLIYLNVSRTIFLREKLHEKLHWNLVIPKMFHEKSYQESDQESQPINPDSTDRSSLCPFQLSKPGAMKQERPIVT